MADLHFDRAEAVFIAHSADPNRTRKRIRLSIVVPLMLIALTLGLFWRDAHPRMLLWFFVGYIAINMFEKIGYGFGVLVHKRVIQKLLARIAELESRASPDANRRGV